MDTGPSDRYYTDVSSELNLLWELTTHECFRALHDLTKDGECVVLDVIGVEHCLDATVFTHGFAAFAHVDSILLDGPQDGRCNLVHALSVANVGIQLTKYEEHVQEYSLCFRLAEIWRLWHASLDILLDLGAQFFILVNLSPWRRLLFLSFRQMKCLRAAAGSCSYLSILTQWINLSPDVVWVVDESEEVLP